MNQGNLCRRRTHAALLLVAATYDSAAACTDSYGWTNPYGAHCHDFMTDGHCTGRGFVVGHEWAAAAAFGSAGENCCVCGKSFVAAIATRPPDDVLRLYAVEAGLEDVLRAIEGSKTAERNPSLSPSPPHHHHRHPSPPPPSPPAPSPPPPSPPPPSRPPPSVPPSPPLPSPTPSPAPPSRRPG